MNNFKFLGINFNWQSFLALLPQFALVLEKITGHPANEWNTLAQQGISLVMAMWGSIAAGNFSITSTRMLGLLILLATAAGPFFNIDFLKLFSDGKELTGVIATLISMFGISNGIEKEKLNNDISTMMAKSLRN
ncbi:MAG TPA: hypothetical protein DCQ93_08635 [Bacteroidetes bacterium]|nr:hypothetical protein [Bacteroidota bacterium]